MPSSSCTEYIETITLENGENQYTITLCSVVCNTDGHQTWTYKLEEKTGSKEISNWALQLCTNANVIDTSPKTLEIGPPKGAEGDCLSEDGEDECSRVSWRIKWDDLSIPDDGQTFRFKLDKCYECRQVHVAIKTGNLGQGEKCLCGSILGPSCTPGTCPPLVTRGIVFM